MYDKNTTAKAVSQTKFPFFSSVFFNTTTSTKSYADLAKYVQRKSNAAKDKLPVIVTHSQTFNKKGQNISLSLTGSLVIDIDHREKHTNPDLAKADTINAFPLIEKLPFVALAFVSPSETGIKIFIPIPVIELDNKHKGDSYIIGAYKAAGKAITAVLSDEKFEADESAMDLKRLCYVPANREYGVSLYLNENAEPFTAFEPEKETKQTKPKTKTKTKKEAPSAINREQFTLRKELRRNRIKENIIPYVHREKGYKYEKGSRNNFSVEVAYRCCITGIPVGDTLSILSEIYPSFRDKDAADVRRIYKSYGYKFGYYLEHNQNKQAATKNINPDLANPDAVIEFKKRLSTKKDELLSSLRTDKTNLLQAPTGSGKTYSLAKNAIQTKGCTVFLVPNTRTVKQLENEYRKESSKVLGVCENVSETAVKKHIEHYNGNVLLFSTYASGYKIRNACFKTQTTINHFILDEFHAAISMQGIKSAETTIKQLFSFSRSKSIQQKTFVTATPSSLLLQKEVLSLFDFHWIQCKDIAAEKKEIRWIDSNKNAVFIDLLNQILEEYPDHKVVIRCTRKENGLKGLKSIIESETGIYAAIINKDTDNEETESIIQQQRIKDSTRIILCTSVLDSAININNEKVIPVFLMNANEGWNYENVAQFFERFRKTNAPRYLFGRKKNKKAYANNGLFRWHLGIARGLQSKFNDALDYETQTEQLQDYSFLSIPQLSVKKLDGKGNVNLERVLFDSSKGFYFGLNTKLLVKKLHSIGYECTELSSIYNTNPDLEKELTQKLNIIIAANMDVPEIDEETFKKGLVQLLMNDETANEYLAYFLQAEPETTNQNWESIDFFQDAVNVDFGDESPGKTASFIMANKGLAKSVLNKFLRLYPFAENLGLTRLEIAVAVVQNENNAKFLALNARIAFLHRKANKGKFKKYLSVVFGNKELAEKAFVAIASFKLDEELPVEGIVKKLRDKNKEILADLSDRKIWLLLSAVNNIEKGSKIKTDEGKRLDTWKLTSKYSLADLKTDYCRPDQLKPFEAGLSLSQQNQRTSFDFVGSMTANEAVKLRPDEAVEPVKIESIEPIESPTRIPFFSLIE